mmetsp:Transcript_16940/g.39942  ORF Transcript_16940/g.39942 Transcript_16940/m.39942 type:complete len:297 (+) Transcript_16940:610-1500(+)
MLGNSDEVVEHKLALGLEPSLVPSRPELAPTTDVGQDVGPPTLQPQLALNTRVGRSHGDLESTVAVEQGRAGSIARCVASSDNKVRNLGSVGRNGLGLLHNQALTIEARGASLGDLHTACGDVDQVDRPRGDEAGLRAEDDVAVAVGRVHGQCTLVGQRQGLASPLAVCPDAVREDARHNVIEHGNEQLGLGGGHILQRSALVRGEDDLEGRQGSRGHELVHVEREQRALGGTFPVLLDLEHELAHVVLVRADLLGQRQLNECRAIRRNPIVRALEERLSDANKLQGAPIAALARH